MDRPWSHKELDTTEQLSLGHLVRKVLKRFKDSRYSVYILLNYRPSMFLGTGSTSHMTYLKGFKLTCKFVKIIFDNVL